MTETIAPLIEESIDIQATPAQIWALVSDLPRLSEWSPQVAKSIVRGKEPIQLGTQLFNINRRGPLVWPTRSKVTVFDPHHVIAFKILDNKSVWAFMLEPQPDGSTRVTHTRRTPDGLTPISVFLTKRVFGGQRSFGEELQAGMRQTLARIKSLAEQAA